MTHIKLESISKSFGSNQILSDIKLDINAGECFAIVGSNGKGKTTLLRIIAGIVNPNQGDVLFDGISLKKNKAKIQKKIGYFPEKPNLYDNMNIKENLHFFASLKNLPKKQVEEEINTWTHQLQLLSDVDKKVSTLSQGAQYKVSFIRCLLGSPDVILLDEPNATIDNDTLLGLKKELVNLKKNGKTIVVISHQLSFIDKLADRIGFLQNQLRTILSSDELYNLNKRPLLEIDCEMIADDCLEELIKFHPDLQLNKDKTHLRIELKENNSNHNDFITKMIQMGVKVKQFHEVPITPEQLYKKVLTKA
ncbi:MAG: hypothetical protein COA79_13200 [Planctomycetota bacterium]|nr:MAG: hypothetical protein COA79_13200 [Planctomycetota bacterium]